MKKRTFGFTLIELMIVIAIVAILVSLALPSYRQWVRKANRGDAQAQLINWAANQEIWRATNASYATAAQLAKPSNTAKYSYNDPTNLSASTYTLTVVAQGDQAKDEERNTSCTTMTLDHNGSKTPAVCWQE